MTAAPTTDLEGLFTRLYTAYRDPLCAYVYRMVGDADVAHDLTQAAFEKAWKALPAFRPQKPQSERGWLYAIAHRATIDHIRHVRLLRFEPWDAYCSVFHPSQVAADRPEAEALQAELRALVAETLRRLPPQYARALRLYEFEGLSYEECAAQLGTTRTAFKTQVFRARAAFCKHWPAVSGEALPCTTPVREHRGGGLGLQYRPGRWPGRPWRLSPYDPVRRRQVWLGGYATKEEATAALAAWQAGQPPQDTAA